MKNIYFYIYPEKEFAEEYVHMSEAQIDNSLLYWNPEDILVVTNFPWQYRDIKSIVVGKQLYSEVQSHGTSLSNKPLTISYLIQNNMVDDINWFHDWDIWQLAPLDLPPFIADIGFVDYGVNPKINLGSIFFKPSAIDVMHWITDAVNKYKQNEEEATNTLIDQNLKNIKSRFTVLNSTYNIKITHLDQTIEKANKPLKIVHFPPYKPKYLHKSHNIIPKNLYNTLSEKFNTKTKSMKNLMVYISPNNAFNPEHKLMMEVQIENSLDYWKPEDILLLTNFPYEHNGVKAIVGPDDLINDSYKTNERGIINSKVNAIIYLLENKLIDGPTWFHDVDSFQLAPLDLPPMNRDIGVTCYGIYPDSRLTLLGKDYKHRVNFGNVFFKPESLDIFKLLLYTMDEKELYEEDAMTVILGENYGKIRSRVQIMNQTYNIGMRCVRSNINIADKPIRVAHFPPHDPKVLSKFGTIIPPKLFKMLNDRFTVKEEIRDLQELQFSDDRRIWKPFMEKYNCQRIAEIGVYQGDNFRKMIEHNPQKAVAADAWMNDGVPARNDNAHTQNELDKMHNTFKSEVTDKSFVEILRKYSLDAASQFPAEYFDLIYIDADHTFEGCLLDIAAWYPKVRKGGYIVGDDYSEYIAPKTNVKYGVVEAVNQFAKTKNLMVHELPSYGWAIIK